MTLDEYFERLQEAADRRAQTDESPLLVYRHELAKSAGDNLEAYVRNGRLYMEIENPWAGDTETGFGADCDISMSESEAREFAAWILSAFDGGDK